MKKTLCEHLCFLGEQKSPYDGFDRLRGMIAPWAEDSLGFVIFLKHSILTAFPIVDASPDDGLFLHAPRGVGIEHVAGVIRADGRPCTSLSALQHEAATYFKLPKI